jgi:bisphosphoglycerate-dependent phosphoglycerate mutase
MKTIYFVRHGESETNAGDILLGPTAQLTEKGKEQAQFIAERCAKIFFEVIISSTYPRAKDTAQVILERNKTPIEYSDLFVERRQPTSIVGSKKTDPHYLAYIEQLKLMIHYGVLKMVRISRTSRLVLVRHCSFSRIERKTTFSSSRTDCSCAYYSHK